MWQMARMRDILDESLDPDHSYEAYEEVVRSLPPIDVGTDDKKVEKKVEKEEKKEAKTVSASEREAERQLFYLNKLQAAEAMRVNE